MSGINNVDVQCMDASESLPSGSFDVIAITCAVEDEIDRFAEALKPKGRLFVVTGKSPIRKAELVTRGEDGAVDRAELFETDIPAMVTAARPPVFSF